MDYIGFLLVTSLILLSPLTSVAQQGAPTSQSRPAPHFTGQLVSVDGVRRLSLNSSKSGTFTGSLQSTCMVPQQLNPGESKPLDLSAIPIGTQMTVYYVRHAEKGDPGKRPENIILGIRLDRVPGRDPTLPKGVAIPCFSGARGRK